MTDEQPQRAANARLFGAALPRADGAPGDASPCVADPACVDPANWSDTAGPCSTYACEKHCGDRALLCDFSLGTGRSECECIACGALVETKILASHADVALAALLQAGCCMP